MANVLSKMWRSGGPIVTATVVVLAVAAPASAGGLGEAAELEHARANARAGGPVSERDKELLERYGCLSGTNSAFCRRLAGGAPPRPQRRRTQR
jgi:hypothetical protein